MKSIQVDDVLFSGRNAFRVTGVYLGTANQQSVIGLASMRFDTPSPDGLRVDEMFVPIELVEDATTYRKVSSGQVG